MDIALTLRSVNVDALENVLMDIHLTIRSVNVCALESAQMATP